VTDDEIQHAKIDETNKVYLTNTPYEPRFDWIKEDYLERLRAADEQMTSEQFRRQYLNNWTVPDEEEVGAAIDAAVMDSLKNIKPATHTQIRQMSHWDKPILATDGAGQLMSWNECDHCTSHGPHPAEEVDGVLMLTCRHCQLEFAWKAWK
jgi:hypothetical protein